MENGFKGLFVGRLPFIITNQRDWPYNWKRRNDKQYEMQRCVTIRKRGLALDVICKHEIIRMVSCYNELYNDDDDDDDDGGGGSGGDDDGVGDKSNFIASNVLNSSALFVCFFFQLL